MTATPEPVSPEVRRSPDGRLIAYCRSARHGLWRKSDGYDCDTEDVADWTPLVPAVSPAPDTEALRHRLAARLARLDAEQWGGDHDFAPYGKDRESDSVVDAAAEVFEAVQAEREAGLRADLDQALRDVDRLTAAAHTYRENWMRVGRERDVLWDRATTAERQIERLRAELAGARTIPDDAAERVTVRRLPEVHASPNCACGYNLAGAAFVDPLCEKFLDGNRHKATPTTDPAPAAAVRPMPADEKPVLAHTTGWQGVVERAALRCADVDGRNWNLVSEADRDRYRQYGMAMFRALPPHIAGQMSAAPQAPAEPTGTCPRCHCAEPIHKTWCEDPLVPAPGFGVTNRDYIQESDVADYEAEERRIAAESAAREDAATPPLPLHEQADLLTWRVVHVPPGTTDREDTDTPITPGWWLVGHGDDPDHPDVQVHLGDRLPTSSAATPGDECNDDLGGWVRPTPIQPEEA